jgi:hypothetical protein
MNLLSHQFPAVARPDAAVTRFAQWTVGGRERQAAAADAVLAAWSHVGWPDGLLAHAIFAADDGDTLLQYSQWRDVAALAAFREGARPAWMDAVDARVPGIGRDWAYETRLYRSMLPHPELPPGCLALISFATDGPEPQRAFVDALFDRVASTPDAHHPGSIAAHFHLSTDGARIFNFAVWTSAEAHAEMVQARLHDGSPLRRFIDEFPGLRPLGLRRYRLRASLQAPPPARG